MSRKTIPLSIVPKRIVRLAMIGGFDPKKVKWWYDTATNRIGVE